MIQIKKKIKSVLTPIVHKYFEHNLIQYADESNKSVPDFGFFGGYNTYEDVSKDCNGYGTDEIVNKVKASTLKVKNGQAIYERDSVVFNQIQYSWPLLSCLLKVALTSSRKLNIVDFGGSLGSSYYQNQAFLELGKNINWHVVEQPHFVDIGIKNFADNSLHFNKTLSDAVSENNEINCILLSSVLQYLDDPYSFLDLALSFNFEYIILDRTTFTEDSSEFPTLQKVPPQIYSAQYPAWFFNEYDIKKKLETKYTLIAEWESLGGRIPIYFPDSSKKWALDKGFFYKLTNQPKGE